MIRALAAAAALLLALPALAQAPPAQPTRDFSVTYRIQPDAGGDPVHVRISHSATLQRQRIEQIENGTPAGEAMLLDLAGQRVTLLDPQQRTAAELPAGLTDLAGDFLALFNITPFKPQRIGADRVLGQPCTLWRLSEDGAEVGTACVTDSGILLRATELTASGERGRVEATALDLAPPPASAFEVPADYQRIQVPLPPGLAPPRQ